ncbi:type 1 fimbrial protein [Klebsiella oxytoca]|uniref:Type 1 fimbrial protein n=2 Tax=Klebsiella oxytoca TaxID=571 RepID=A0AAI9DWI4_KLEOX|nr:type 1 fimbrial protein [Klebsiella oxytoca]ELM5277906.1 type 1 fimbrial protein [Klebsiella oxytoca]MBZ7279605.1 type 1 fimbrial protein [Klebsiella oxytoca]MBZ7716368.1 type 1 fimbrial protein [Klebsiella oxytoca]QLX73932.1 type 1 fimbrial protein [Klebsiella oxytoca]
MRLRIIEVISCLTAALGIMMTAVPAFATDINLTGTVVASACTVDTAHSINQTITFPDSKTSDFTRAGDASEWQNYTIVFTSCPPSTTDIIVNFSGTPDPSNKCLAKNDGSATGIALQSAFGKDGGYLQNCFGGMTGTAYETGRTIELSSRMIATSDRVTGGSFHSTLLLTVTYK